MLQQISDSIRLGVSIANVLTNLNATSHVAGGLCRDFLLVSQMNSEVFNSALSGICGGDIDIIYSPRHDPSYRTVEEWADKFCIDLRKAGFNVEVTDMDTDYDQCRLYGVVQLKVNGKDVDILIHMAYDYIVHVCDAFDFKGNAAYATNDPTTGEIFVNATGKFWDAYEDNFHYEFPHLVATANQIRRADKRLALYELVAKHKNPLTYLPLVTRRQIR
ncbi:hypothetical protein Spp001_47 [Shewanella phage Spp001]|uniref:Uncharacterized protein n=1 Tax=Shewanella phage Spp001 TaxID=1445859 RepID=W6EBW1_9CAUD|nr:hypothetical protein Spp001_47 [Shewanella phage Spp001]AHJ10555.1 hypothetical protein Spp001_47 [Shewanella phage Spp001]